MASYWFLFNGGRKGYFRFLGMSETPKDQDELTEEEAAKRRDEALKRALGTPPKPHKGGKEQPEKEGAPATGR